MNIHQSSKVVLHEITAATVREVCRLEVSSAQKHLVAPNAMSIAEAYFEPAAWFRAIKVNDDLVGFAMLYDPSKAVSPPAGRELCFLWRLMIDSRYQRRGYGLAALELLIAHARTINGVKRFGTSYVPGPDSAGPLYERIGMRPTGEVDDGEIVVEMQL